MRDSKLSYPLSSLFVVTLLATVCFAAKPGDWPQWRGIHRDGQSAATGLLKDWPEDGPRVAWQVDGAGVGYSSLAVADGRVVTQGDLDGVEHIICFSEEDGSILWAVQPEPTSSLLQQQVDSQFEKFDKNSDGKLDEIEALTALGWSFNEADGDSLGDKEEIASKRVATLFEAFDKDGDGKLTFEEVPGAMQRELSRIDAADAEADAKELSETRTKALIAAVDKDEDGKASRKEAGNGFLGMMFGNIDERDPETRKGDDLLTFDEIQKFLFTREQGRDGVVTAAELQAFFVRTYPGRDGELVKSDLKRHYGGFRNGMGDGPRGTPTIEGNRIYAEGGNGDLTCLDAETGKTIWFISLTRDLQGGRPGWGYSESPLIDGGRLIVTPGGNKGCVAALDKNTGEVVWRSEDVKDAAHYSSAIVADIDGVHQIIQFTRNRVVGLDAADGKLLWDYSNSANGTANCATPVYSDGCVFSSSAYGVGGGLCKIVRDGDGFKAEEVYFDKSLANHHGGIVLVDGYMYGFGNGGLICMNFKTGEIAWRARSVGKGSLCFADGRLYLWSEGGQLALAEANPNEYVETGRISLPRSDRPSWAHPVVANGRLYIRDQGILTAYAITAEK